MKNEQHLKEILLNSEHWEKKKLLQKVYYEFYELIKSNADFSVPGNIVELGSGIGKIKDIIPNCITTDIFDNPWVDRVEDAYKLNFEDNSVSNLILFDVFHHLEFPGNAFDEFHRVLNDNGRIIIFDPCMSVLGLLSYGLLHHEPISISKEISVYAKDEKHVKESGYYAAQGNAYRIFQNQKKYEKLLSKWEVIKYKKYSAISYLLSGGYSKPQLYPTSMYGFMKAVDSVCNIIPILYATRMLVVLKKRNKDE
jgi:SAM-dependent methyltransferase